MGNTILKTTEGFQVTSVHKPPASLLPYHSFIYTDCQEKSLVSLRQTTLFIFYLLVFKSTTFRSFASCHSCNICSCHCILSMACRDQSCEADLFTTSSISLSSTMARPRILDGSKQHSGHLHSTFLI